METKTSAVFEQMNYFLTLKESDGQTSSAYEEYILPTLSDIFANQVRHGLHTLEDAENFRDMLPQTSEMFDNPRLHGNCASLQGQFEKMVQVGLVEYKVAQSESQQSMGKVM